MISNNNIPAIKLCGLKKKFGIGDAETYVLNGIDLTVERGEFIAIMGPSGCGKTTLLNILGLLDQSIEGDYELNGRSVSDISRRKQAKIRSQEIGYVFQNFNLISRLTIIENVALPLVYKGVGHTKRLIKASEILRNFHLNEREYYMPHQLSGGQVQRVAIARALVNDPTIILADEPTGNLDSRSSDVIMEELSNLHKRGNTIIMVTHNPALTSYASRVITMLDGKIETDSNEKSDKTFDDFHEENTIDGNNDSHIDSADSNNEIDTIVTIEDIENLEELNDINPFDDIAIIEEKIAENHKSTNNNQSENNPSGNFKKSKKRRHRHRSKNKSKRNK